MAVLLQQYDIENVPERAKRAKHSSIFWLVSLSRTIHLWLSISQMKRSWHCSPRKDEKCTLMVLPETQQEKRKKIRRIMCSIKILFIYPNNAFISYSFSLTKVCSKSTVNYEDDTIEYKGLITWLELSLKIPIANLTMYNDFKPMLNKCAESTQ